MKKYILLCAVFLLSACASTETVLNGPVSQTFHSKDSQTKVAFCLANKNNTAALDREDGAKVVLIKNGYGGVSMAFSVYPDGTGSRIEYRKKFGTIGGIWRKCIGPEAERAAELSQGVALRS
jgi:starvation-inducible outer membrane lipoprotein